MDCLRPEVQCKKGTYLGMEALMLLRVEFAKALHFLGVTYLGCSECPPLSYGL